MQTMCFGFSQTTILILLIDVIVHCVIIMILTQLINRSIRANYVLLNQHRYCMNWRIPEPASHRLNIYKKSFYVFLFASVLGASVYLRKIKEKRSAILKEATRLRIAFGRMNLYSFRNFILPEEVLPLIKQLPDFQWRSDDIVISSFPKTGVTWLQEIIWLIVNNYDFDGALLDNLENRFPFLEWPLPGLPSIIKMSSPRLIKTHLPPSILFNGQEKIEPKCITITRNPKDVAVSYYFFSRMNMLFDYKESIGMFIQRFIIGEIAYGPLHRHYIDVLKYSLNQDNRVLIVSYEDLHEKFEEVINQLCVFLGKPLPNTKTMERLKAHCNFKFMQVNPMVNYNHWDIIGLRDPNESRFFRAGQVGNWTNYLNEEQSKLIDNYYSLYLKDLFTFKFKLN